jgi:hypothetical protein
MVDSNPSPSGVSLSNLGGAQNLSSLHISTSPRNEKSQKGIGDFLNELKLARENSILGNYEEALKKYKSTL